MMEGSVGSLSRGSLLSRFTSNDNFFTIAEGCQLQPATSGRSARYENQAFEIWEPDFWGNLVLSSGLIMWTGHRKDVRKLSRSRNFRRFTVIYIITKSMLALWLVNQLWFIVPVNSWKNCASSEFFSSNRPQVSMVYRLINHSKNS